MYFVLKFPSGMDEQNVWIAPNFQGDYRHNMDLSAFVSQEPSAPPPPSDNPPPYTEQLLEGHISLMYGTKEPGNKDGNEDDDNMLNQSAQERSRLSTDVYPEEYHSPHEAIQMEYNGSDMEGVQEMPSFAMSDYADDNMDLQTHSRGLVHLNSTPTRMARSPSNISESDPFYDIPNQTLQAPVRQLFQRPTRSNSIDNSSINLSRDQSSADSSLEQNYLPRLAPLTPPSTLHQQDTQLRLRPLELTPNNPFIARPANGCLPPLRSRTPSSAPQRKRTKRKRGHSWHGGPISLSSEQAFVNTSAMATVAE